MYFIKPVFLFFFMLTGGFIMGKETFLLRNHDFRYWGGSRYPLADWRYVIQSPGTKFEFSVPLDRGEIAREIILSNHEAVPALWYQKVKLPAGEYRFSIELRSEGKMKGFVSVAGVNVMQDAEKEWRVLQGEFKLEKDQDVTFHFGTSTIGKIAFRNFDVEVLRLRSAPVQTEDGRQIGCIELPSNATIAEQFAVYELQRYLKEMCGAAPGLKGRDEISDGLVIKVGRAVPESYREKVQQSGEDSFLISVDDQSNLYFAGNNDRGTLYAIYEFLQLQGCSWTTPGAIGETVPKRKSILLPSAEKISRPAFRVRGFMFYLLQFRSDGGWEFYSYDELFDWALRNRYNAVWAAGNHTLDMMPHRGGSILQTLNHSWHNFLLDEHPEWFPLVDGKRLKTHTSGRPNQLCVSNPELRRYVTDYIIQFFRKNPNYQTFGLSPEDEPCYWCECQECRKLDADQGKGKWRKDASGRPVPAFMTDRMIDFVSDIAERVGEKMPGKMLECYSYSSTMSPPLRSKVAKNLIIRYCHWAEAAYWDKPLWSKENDIDRWSNKISDCLAGWRRMSKGELALYDYDNYLYPDAVFPQLSYAAESLESFNQRFGINNYIPESSSQIWSNPLLYQLRAESLWGEKQGNFEERKAELCKRYFGIAGATLYQYYHLLETAICKGEYEMRSAQRMVKNKTAVYLGGLAMKDLTEAEKLLDKALTMSEGNSQLQARLNWIRFAHYITVMAVVSNLSNASASDISMAETAFRKATALSRENDIFFMNMGHQMLQNFYRIPVIKKSYFTLPLKWKLVLDPSDKIVDSGIPLPNKLPWHTVSIESDWTSQGIDYHGSAWYQVEFTLPKDVKTAGLDLHFGAVDGTAEIYLDGTLLGVQDKDPGLMWDKPFTVSIPHNFPARDKHVLTVKVTKQSQAAGIWRKVELVELEKTEDTGK